MFDIGFWELALIAVIGLIVLGPERLPGAARTLGRWIGKARRYADSLRHELENAAGADDLRRDVDSFRRDMESFRGEVDRGGRQLRAEVEGDGNAQPASRQPGGRTEADDHRADIPPDRTVRRGRRLRTETASDDAAPESSGEPAMVREAGEAAADPEHRE